MSPKLFTIFLLVGLVLSACAPSGPSASASDAIAAGRGEFIAQCASCHSVDGTGSDMAPSVIGRSAEVLTTQVRNPVGGMPAFSSAVISDANLELLVQYVLSLNEGEEIHKEITPTEEERVYLLVAFEAIEDYQNMDREAAINHLQQAVALASSEAAEEYAELIEAIEDGKAGNARHELEEMLGMMEH
jgi:mono/diheme cytochrome c family protein